MPELKTRTLFISHAWNHDDHYCKVVEWFNAAQNFSWKNSSVPSHDSLPDKTTSGLRAGLTRQINPAHGVIILAGMYAAHSDWIDHEIQEAKRMGKIIIGVAPRGQERIPLNVQQAAGNNMVAWNSASLIQVVRTLI